MGKLVRLELCNFKSYKGHQKIELGDAYFTSIIGPNGSGKSNSMDAISFVLGIKSSHLRSAHLRDLIYRGRKLRAPENGEPEDSATQSGDPKTAWVMAVYLDDRGEEPVEHKWKRSITADGASKYHINGKAVGAAEYNAALEKYNILIKARNFLVFQGDVEAIASQSPKDLTRLIEQISGSLEYRAEYEKMKEEEKQAAETATFNLNRRRGINAEIKQYQEQKKEAENYQAKVEERDEAIVSHVLWKLFHFQATMEQNKAEIEKHQHELQEFRRAHEKYHNRLEEAKTEQAKATKSVSQQERHIKRKEKELESSETSLVPVDEKINISVAHLKKYSARIKEIKRDHEQQEATVKSLQKDRNVIQKAQAKFEKEQAKLAAEKGTVLNETDLAEYNKLKERVNTEVAGEQINIDNYTRQQKTDAESVNSLKSKVESAEYQLRKSEGELSDLKERQSQEQLAATQMSQDIEVKKKEYNTMTSERLRNAQKQTELNEKLEDCLAKLKEADDGRRESERELRIKETILTLKRIFPGVKGRVSELCRPRLKKYGEAVATVLGRNLDAVVVDNESTAKQCIEYLRDQRAGQATFLPVDTIQVKPLNSNLKGMHRGMRMAIDTIEFDSSVERAMLYACGNAVVCDDLDVAKYIVYTKGVEVKAVTLDGTVIHKGGLMTGGRVGNGGGRRWDDQEVEGLKRLRDNLMSQIAALPKNRRGQQEEILQGELSGLEQRLAYHREELGHLKRSIKNKETEVAHTKKQLTNLTPQLSAATSSLTELQAKVADLQKIVSAAEDKFFSDFCKRLGFPNIREYEKRQGSLQQEAAEKKLEFATQRSKIDSQLVFEERRLKETTERIQNLEKLAQRDEAQITELEDEKAAIRASMDALEAELELMREELQTRREEQEKRAQRVADLKREVAKRSTSLEETNKAIAALEAEMDRNAAGRYAILRRCKLEEISIPLTDESAPLDDLPIDDTLAQPDPDGMDVDEEDEDAVGSAIPRAEARDYGIEVDFEELDAELQESADESIEATLLEKIKTLSSELDRMAPNMKAISRLSDVESRLSATAAEFEASKAAAKTAKESFAAIKEKRRTLFTKAFEHISSQIDDIYKELTRGSADAVGGRAYLDMEDADEPYLEGVKYHAMPPTKRFRDMELLSGGEKTMAALALLFAVHSYQPSPFFVLDEVDAALDNANVQKISNYIRNHAAPGFQFIVISLKAGLFQQSEALVGIYRDQVECSSRCLTLDLRKYVDERPAI